MSGREGWPFPRALTGVLAAGFLLRVAYVLVQPRFDPAFARPMLDGEHYVALAKAGVPAGVFYMPPLYPMFLGAFLALVGESWGTLYVLQHLLVVAAAGGIGLATRRIAGPAAGIAAAALVLLYHPALFFASRPLGEPLAIALMAGAVALAPREGAASGAAAGAAAGLAALVRPNLLPLPAAWAALDLVRGAWRRGALLLGAAVLAILPAACHNLAASGRLVPVSANGGVVFWLGNAPGALGVYTPADGFSGRLASQQDEAIAGASRAAGRTIDAVEADRYWMREGMRARLSDPVGTALLVLRRVALTFDAAEHGLDYAPRLDRNPLRWFAPLPFALLLGLAVAGVVARGVSGTGGGVVWSAIAINALTPIAFYVSSRHRLPFAVLLAVPAGIAAGALPALAASRRGKAALGAGALAALASLAVPSGGLARAGEASSLAALANVERRGGDLAGAAATAHRAIDLDPSCVVAWYNLGVIEVEAGRRADAERAYRGALAVEPAHAGAAGNLAGILLTSGRAPEAVALLEGALAASPRHGVLWTNLVVGYVSTGSAGEARRAIERARAEGVELNPDLVRTVMDMEALPR